MGILAPGSAHARPSTQPPTEFLLLIGILIFMLLRSPCKNLKPYDNPFWGFEQRYEEEEEEKKKKINYQK